MLGVLVVLAVAGYLAYAFFKGLFPFTAPPPGFGGATGPTGSTGASK